MENPSKIEQATLTLPATFIAFDVLSTDKPHTQQPLEQRKEIKNLFYKDRYSYEACFFMQ